MMFTHRTAETPTVTARRGQGMLARVVLVALVATLLVPFEQPASYAVPVTLTETLDGLPEQAGAASALEAAEDAAPEDAAPEDVARSRTVEAPIAFSAAGFLVPDAVTGVRLRTSVDGETWGDWVEVEFMDVLDGPDPGTLEERVSAPGKHTESVWVGEASHLQLDVDGGTPEDVEVTLIDSMRLNDGPVERVRDTAIGASADASELNIVTRAQWGADESITRDARAVDEVYMGVVHHTAHTTSSSVANGYSREQVPGLIRAMHRYHTVNLGWSDIGYNLLVDRFGTIYEGRRGGVTKGVIGAHAAGNNTHSFGVSVIGNFLEAEPSAAALASLTEVIAFKSAIHSIDPTGWTNRVGDGSWRPTIVGHRDVGQTSCPGRIQPHLSSIREQARDTAVRFPDVPTASPHRPAILTLAETGVTRGCEANLYCPDDTLTRAQAASFMVRAFELDPIRGSRFTDVGIDATHSPEINALTQLSWLLGYPDGTFRPVETLTRGQLASLLSRTLPPADPYASPPSPYPDVTTSHAHYDGVMQLAAYGVRGDCDGRGGFCPDDPVRRDSTASFVHMVLQAHTELPTPYGYEAQATEELELVDPELDPSA